MAKILIFIGLIVLTIVLLAFTTVISIYTNTNLDPNNTKLGIFGDTIGGVLNPILTTISFLAILYTIYLQSRELAATNKELARSAEAHEKNLEKIQTQINSQQEEKFESLFFKLIEMHESLSKEILNETIEILELINEEKNEYAHITVNYIDHQYKTLFLSKIHTISTSRRRLHSKNNIHGRYFIFLYQILKTIFLQHNSVPENEIKNVEFINEFINNGKINFKEKYYSNLIRSLVNNKIIALLMINCATEENGNNYLTYNLLLKRYCFFENFAYQNNESFPPKTSVTKIERQLVDIYDDEYFVNNEYYTGILKKVNIQNFH